MRKIRVGVLFGGRSGEHEVSLVSATSVMAALDPRKYEVVPIGITKEGRWVAGREVVRLLKKGRVPLSLTAMLPPDPGARGLVPLPGSRLAPEVVGPLDVIFPVLHGPLGEDGTLQGLLELADLPYVGAGVLGCALGMDKAAQKRVLAAAGLPVAPWLWFRDRDWQQGTGQARLNATRQVVGGGREQIMDLVQAELGLPCFLKPANMGSSVGISKAHDRGELASGIEEALHYDRKLVAEWAVPGAREIEVSVLGNEQPRASVPGEIIPCHEFYDYDAKYVDDASRSLIPASLAPELTERVRSLALEAFLACEGEGMARVDFLLAQDGRVYVSELNTIPGFTNISMYPKLWEASGLPFPELLDELIRLALERHQAKARLLTSYRPKQDWYAE